METPNEIDSGLSVPVLLRRDDSHVISSKSGNILRTNLGEELLDVATGGFGSPSADTIAPLLSQMQKMSLSSRVFYTEPLARLCRRLASLTTGLEAVYPCNSPDEALDGAIKLAKGYQPKRVRIAVVGNANGGRTVFGHRLACRAPLCVEQPEPMAIDHLAVNDAAALDTAIDRSTAAVFIEPVITCGRIIQPDLAYLSQLRRRCDETGALLVFDELVCGLGATGALIAGDRIVPDVLLLGATLGGNVFPCAAYVAKERINRAVYRSRDPVLHATTTGANPAACVMALATLDFLQTPGVLAEIRARGESFKLQLSAFIDDLSDGGIAVDGIGTLWSLTFTNAARAKALVGSARAHGLLLRHEAQAGDAAIVQVRMPIGASADDWDLAFVRLSAALSAID